MNNQKPQQTFNFRKTVRRFLLSAFVVVSFVAYALSRPFYTSADTNASAAGPAPTALVAQQAFPSAAPALSDTPAAVDPPVATQPAPTDTAPAPTLAQSGQYKDGTYTGPEVDAFYGLVKVQTVIKNGKIASVQFLEYPSDRRTSVRINSFAVPNLQQEAIQSQSANVDLITGATLTSQAFVQSLQTALDQARNGA
jgi:uncharacterized protein with FMN-binding domain